MSTAFAQTYARQVAGSDASGDDRTAVVSLHPSPAPAARTACTVLIEDRALFRDCVLSSLQEMEPGHRFEAFESVGAWAQSQTAGVTSLVVLWMSELPRGPAADDPLRQRLQQVARLEGTPPVAVMSDHDDPASVAHAIESGARAFLPTNLGVEVMVKILALVRAGGTFIPATALARAPSAPVEGVPSAEDLGRLLTPRQLAIARAIRKGLPNKLIAYELAMCEGTVKVHVRTIMKKLKAKNRTEVAFMTRGLDTGTP